MSNCFYPRLQILPEDASTIQKLLPSSESGNAVTDCCPDPLPIIFST